MRRVYLTIFFPIYFLISSCLGPRNIEYKTIWSEQGKNLKILLKTIKSNKKYKWGNHDFPDYFSYPFDDGFNISYGYDKETGKAISYDDKNITIKFYTDRGLMDHFSAFIYTNDLKVIEQLNTQVDYNHKDTDVKLEKYWYYIQE